jgi:hypothetical protein
VAVADEILREKLRDFTRRVANELSYEDCAQWLANRDSKHWVEYEDEDTPETFLTFMWDLLTLEEVGDRMCARVHTHICDDRLSGLGSVYTPLCSGLWLFKDGGVEYFPLGNGAATTEQIEF